MQVIKGNLESRSRERSVSDLIICLKYVEEKKIFPPLDQKPLSNYFTTKTDRQGFFTFQIPDKFRKALLLKGINRIQFYFEVKEFIDEKKIVEIFNTKGWYHWEWYGKKNRILIPDQLDPDEKIRSYIKKLEYVIVIISPVAGDGEEVEVIEPDPAILLPLRIEIREMHGDNYKIANFESIPDPDPNDPASAIKDISLTPISTKNYSSKEYWIRWYPDTLQLSVPIGKITDDEVAKWGVFQNELNRIKAGSGGDPVDLNDAMDLLVENFGSQIEKAFGTLRGRHIIKHIILNNGVINQQGSWDFDTESDLPDDPLELILQEGLTIDLFPNEIRLFTLTDGELEELLEGPIIVDTTDLSLPGFNIPLTHWSIDFETAVDKKMGIRISDDLPNNPVEKIDNCDWLFAVGLVKSEDSLQKFEDILKRRNANGELGIVAQDVPTNNTEGSPSFYTEQKKSLKEYYTKTNHPISDDTASLNPVDWITTEQNVTDAEILTRLLGLDRSTLGEMIGTLNEEQFEAAAATSLLFDPATILIRKYWVETFERLNIDWRHCRRFFIENVRARGNLPILRVDDNPYGLLPVSLKETWTESSDFADDNSYNLILQKIYDVCKFLRPDFQELGSQVPKINPVLGTPLETLLEILRTQRISSEINVRIIPTDDPFNMDSDPMYVGGSIVREFLPPDDVLEDIVPHGAILKDAPFRETAYLHLLSEMPSPTSDWLKIDEEFFGVLPRTNHITEAIPRYLRIKIAGPDETQDKWYFLDGDTARELPTHTLRERLFVDEDPPKFELEEIPEGIEIGDPIPADAQVQFCDHPHYLYLIDRDPEGEEGDRKMRRIFQNPATPFYEDPAIKFYPFKTEKICPCQYPTQESEHVIDVNRLGRIYQITDSWFSPEIKWIVWSDNVWFRRLWWNFSDIFDENDPRIANQQVFQITVEDATELFGFDENRSYYDYNMNNRCRLLETNRHLNSNDHGFPTVYIWMEEIYGLDLIDGFYHRLSDGHIQQLPFKVTGQYTDSYYLRHYFDDDDQESSYIARADYTGYKIQEGGKWYLIEGKMRREIPNNLLGTIFLQPFQNVITPEDLPNYDHPFEAPLTTGLPLSEDTILITCESDPDRYFLVDYQHPHPGYSYNPLARRPIGRMLPSGNSTLNETVNLFEFNLDAVIECDCTPEVDDSRSITLNFDGLRFLRGNDTYLIDRGKARRVPQKVAEELFLEDVGMIIDTGAIQTGIPIPEWSLLVHCPGSYPIYMLDTDAFRHVNELGMEAYHFNPENIKIASTPVLKRILWHFFQIARWTDDFNLAGQKIDGYGIAYHNSVFETIKQSANILKKIPPDKLEILVVELLDTLTYRWDAWQSGFAWHRFKEKVLTGDPSSFNVGVYGWLEKPGSASRMTSKTAEYIQTPSRAQANTAAILRNASLNKISSDDNPFRLNLSSEQVRKGVWYLEGLRKDHSPEELLGYQTERLIHDLASNHLQNIEDLDIYKLRKEFPLKLQHNKEAGDPSDEENPVTFVETVVDGIEFLKADREKLTEIFGTNSDKLDDIEEIQRRVDKTRDAGADIAMSDMLYQFMMGNIDRASAWLDFLDGDCLPPESDFIRSRRTGAMHTTRAILFFNTPASIDSIIPNVNRNHEFHGSPRLGFPRQISAPLLDYLCNNFLGSFASENLTVVIQRQRSTDLVEIQVNPRNHLQFESIDLLVGGVEELNLRLKYFILQEWLNFHYTGTSLLGDLSQLGNYQPSLPHDEFFTEIIIKSNGVSSVNLEIVKSLNKIISKYDPKSLHLAKFIKYGLSVFNVENTSPDLTRLNPVITNIILMKRIREILIRLNYLHSSIIEHKDTKIDPFTIYSMILELIAKIETYQDTNLLISVDNWEERWNSIVTIADSIPEINDILNNHFTDPGSGFITILENIRNLDPNSETYDTDLEPLISNLQSGLAKIKADLEPLITPIRSDLLLLLKEISRYGYNLALQPLPIISKMSSESERILNTLEGCKNFILQKIEKTIKGIRKVIGESILDPSEPFLMTLQNIIPDPTGVTTHPITQWITQKKNEWQNYLDTSEDNDETDQAIWNIKWKYIQQNTEVEHLIQILQAFTPNQLAPIIFPPFLLTDTDDSILDQNWTLDWTNSTQNDAFGTSLQDFTKVLPDLLPAISVLSQFTDATLFENRIARAQDAELGLVSNTDPIGTTDYLYLTTENQPLGKCFTGLLIDEWVEFYPNPVGEETSAIAYRYDAPQSEPPNVILLATPPHNTGSTEWEPYNLAEILKELTELMKIRLVNSNQVIGSNNLGRYLPLLQFGPGLMGIEGHPPRRSLFPKLEKLLYEFKAGTTIVYAEEEQMSDEQKEKTEGPEVQAIRRPNPDLGGSKSE